MAEVQWFEDHYIDEDGRRFALACPWEPDTVGPIPSFLILTQEERRSSWGEPRQKITAAVTDPPAEPPRGHRYRVYLQGEVPTFGSGYHDIYAEIGKKWVRLTDLKGRVRRVSLDVFNSMNPEMVSDVEGEGPAQAVDAAQASDGGAE
jgi:hypothetical protein